MARNFDSRWRSPKRNKARVAPAKFEWKRKWQPPPPEERARELSEDERQGLLDALESGQTDDRCPIWTRRTNGKLTVQGRKLAEYLAEQREQTDE